MLLKQGQDWHPKCWPLDPSGLWEEKWQEGREGQVLGPIEEVGGLEAYKIPTPASIYQASSLSPPPPDKTVTFFHSLLSRLSWLLSSVFIHRVDFTVPLATADIPVTDAVSPGQLKALWHFVLCSLSSVSSLLRTRVQKRGQRF